MFMSCLFLPSSIMETEIIVPKKSKGHKCYLCGQRFITVNILRKHVNIHKDRDYECSVCKKAFSSRCGLRKHMQLHTGERPFKCNICVKSFRQKCTLLDHIQSMHKSNSDPKIYCSTCGKKLRVNEKTQCWFCNYKEVTESVKERANEVLKSCILSEANDDSVVNSSIDSLPEIIEEVISDDIDKCNLSTINLGCASSESITNVKVQPMSCIMCSETFPSIIELRYHISHVHKPDRPFACDSCELRFATPISLEKHLKTHNEVRPFMCLTCGRCFKSNMSLQAHLNTHREDRPFLCKTCGCAFKTMVNLKTHQITHSNNRPFKCKDCSFRFKALDHLRKHVIVHSGEKPYKCETCFKEFRHPGNLGRHYYLHLGQRLYICQICGKDFAQSVGLKQHEQVHDKDYNAKKNLFCPVCGRAYKLEHMLQRHMTRHNSTNSNLKNQ